MNLNFVSHHQTMILHPFGWQYDSSWTWYHLLTLLRVLISHQTRPSSHMLVPHPGHLVCNTILDWHGNKPSNGRQKTHYSMFQSAKCKNECVVKLLFYGITWQVCSSHTRTQTLSHTPNHGQSLLPHLYSNTTQCYHKRLRHKGLSWGLSASE